MRSHLHSVRMHLRCTSQELKALVITSVFATSFVGFRSLNGFSDVLSPPMNLLVLFPVFFSLLFLSVMAQKYVGVCKGYAVTYRFFASGIALGFLIFIISGTFLPLFFPGYLRFELIRNLRMGVFRPRIKQYEMALIGAAGPLFALLLNTLVLGPLALSSEGGVALFFRELGIFNAFLIIFSFLPVPVFHVVRFFVFRELATDKMEMEEGTIGFSVLFASRAFYVFCVIVALVHGLLIAFGGYWSFWAAVLLGFAVAYVYRRAYELAR
ncbi:MAG: hypothetical protein HC945_03410 [Nitrosarchaeum sp.]|nr:hypothetical protein [Nitrosarchaeum sp.]